MVIVEYSTTGVPVSDFDLDIAVEGSGIIFAEKLAKKLKLKVVMINGKNLERLENFLDNKPFIGTIIE